MCENYKIRDQNFSTGSFISETLSRNCQHNDDNKAFLIINITDKIEERFNIVRLK